MIRFYKIVRYHMDSKIDNVVIDRRLTLEEAQKHCQDPETSSKTATGSEALSYTKMHGPWFDGYTEE